MNRLLQKFKWISQSSESETPLKTLTIFEDFDQLLSSQPESISLRVFNDDFHSLNENMIHLDMADPVQADLLEWIRFWQFQFREHIAYLDLLLAKLPAVAFTEDSPLTSPFPENQPQAPKKILQSLKLGAQVVTKLKSVALPLVDQWKKFQDELEETGNSIPIRHLFLLCKWTMAFKMTMLNAQKQAWIGSAYSGLIEHHLEELVAFLMRLSGNMTRTQLVGHSTNIVADHLSLVAHNTTPGGPIRVRKSVLHNLNVAEKGYELLESNSVRSQKDYIEKASMNFHSQMTDQLSQKIPNISLPIDVYHIEREHLFALQKLRLL